MTGNEQPRCEEVPRNQAANMRRLAQAAANICMHGAIAHNDTFSPVPLQATFEQLEPGGGETAAINASMAFTGAFFAPGYGAACAATRFAPRAPVMRAREVWGAKVARQYYREARPVAFRNLFFDNGLWRIFLDPNIPQMSSYRERFEAGDLAALRKDQGLRTIIDSMHTRYFFRDANDLPHVASHTDALWFSNTILRIAEQEWGITDKAEKAAALERNLPALRRIALWHTAEVAYATHFMMDANHPSTYSQDFLRVDKDKREVDFNTPRIEAEVARHDPHSATYARRGCSVLSLRTPYRGASVPIFTVMEKTVTRMYQETGALSDPTLRFLPPSAPPVEPLWKG